MHESPKTVNDTDTGQPQLLNFETSPTRTIWNEFMKSILEWNFVAINSGTFPLSSASRSANN